ncbi:MAG: VWA domain-containing protein [Bacteroidales bacterium]
MKMKNYLPAVFFLGVFSVLIFTSCEKETFEPEGQKDFKTTAIKSSIPRIVENGKGGINVFINVTDQHGKAITGLDKDNFTFEMIAENGDVEKMTPMGAGQLPNLIITALALDYSGSMFTDTISIPAMETAAATFISLKNPYDQIELIKFSKNIQITVPLTDNENLLLAGLGDTTFPGQNSTALYEALELGLYDVLTLAIQNPNYLPSVVGFTDGKNNQPPLSSDSLILNSIIEQVPIYSIGYGDDPDTTVLKNISGQTGGQFFWSPSGSNLNTVYQHINGQLANTTIFPLPGPQTKGKITIRCTTNYEAAIGKLTSVAEKDFYY